MTSLRPHSSILLSAELGAAYVTTEASLPGSPGFLEPVGGRFELNTGMAIQLWRGLETPLSYEV